MTAAVSHCPLAHRMRSGRPEDLPLIIRTWVSSNRGSPVVWGCPSPVYLVGQRALVLRILGASSAVVAVDPEDEAHVYGYCVWQAPNVIHYAFVKEAYRRVGLGTALLRSAQESLDPGGFSYTHSGLIVKEAREKLAAIGAVYNPFLLYG